MNKNGAQKVKRSESEESGLYRNNHGLFYLTESLFVWFFYENGDKKKMGLQTVEVVVEAREKSGDDK